MKSQFNASWRHEILSVYTPNDRNSKREAKWTGLKAEIDNPTTIDGDFNAFPSLIIRTRGQKQPVK